MGSGVEDPGPGGEGWGILAWFAGVVARILIKGGGGPGRVGCAWQLGALRHEVGGDLVATLFEAGWLGWLENQYFASHLRGVFFFAFRCRRLSNENPPLRWLPIVRSTFVLIWRWRAMDSGPPPYGRGGWMG